MKTFTLPFFNHFSLSLNRIKTSGNESHEKETKHIHASAADLSHIKIGNLGANAGITKTKQEKQIVFVVESRCNAY